MTEPKYFDLEEMLYSSTALNKKIPNLPSWNIIENLNTLATDILDVVREEYGSAVYVSSGYRSDKLNAAVNGSIKSQHRKGEAADIYAKDTKRLFDTCKRLIEEGRISVGQLIDENNYSWVHISLPTLKVNNQILHKKV